MFLRNALVHLCKPDPSSPPDYADRHIPVSIFPMTGWILLRFRELVKKFQPRQRLPKADRMVGLIPLWPTSIIPLGPTERQSDGESVHRASDSSPATVQDMGGKRKRDILLFYVPERLLTRSISPLVNPCWKFRMSPFLPPISPPTFGFHRVSFVAYLLGSLTREPTSAACWRSG